MRADLQTIAAAACLIAGVFMVGIGQNDFPPNRFLTVPGGLLLLAGAALVCVWGTNAGNGPFWVRCPHCGERIQRTFGRRPFCPYCGEALGEEGSNPSRK